MVWKTWSPGYERETYDAGRKPELANPAPLLAYVGKAPEGKNAKRIKTILTGHLERELCIADNILGYNSAKGIVFMRIPENNRSFDVYIGMPFTKGATDKKTGRTILIIGDRTHHGQAMQGQFECDPNPYKEFKGKGFGNALRWINVGMGKEGFLGLDYSPKAPTYSGLATKLEDVKFVCNALYNFGMNSEKPVRLLESPYVKESLDGKLLREQHKLNTIEDWVEADVNKIHLPRRETK